jgi:hypothetical protein
MDIDSPPAKVLPAPCSQWLSNHDLMMASTQHTARRSGLLVPNFNLRLREQVWEVMRFKQYSVRTEEAYWKSAALREAHLF